MAESSAPAPPPYSTDTPASGRSLPPGSPVNIVSNANGNLDGLRALILDNAPTLFVLGHKGYKTLPNNFEVVTIRQSPASSTTGVPGFIHACVMFKEAVYKGRNEVRLFVQGAQRETTEAALSALLEKMQEMLGRRWDLPLRYAQRPGPGQVYLES